ncbi:MAG: SRPBCC family protein [Candidatus Dormibacteraceae bacterium]
MQIENVFEITAPPDKVYAFLLDVERIVGCVPGAELVETVDENTFKGKVKIKVGPITVSYSGNAEIAERDAAAHRAVLKATGRETTGSGSARATATMTVAGAEAGSEVRIATDFTVAGRVANFGRGVMEDVSKRLVTQMAACIKANLELEEQAASEAAEGAASPMTTPPTGEPQPEGGTAPPAEGPPEGTGEAPSEDTSTPEPPATPRPRPPVAVQAKPVGAFGLFFSILWDRLKRLFGGGRS